MQLGENTPTQRRRYSGKFEINWDVRNKWCYVARVGQVCRDIYIASHYWETKQMAHANLTCLRRDLDDQGRTLGNKNMSKNK
jgi:hypothetical protein